MKTAPYVGAPILLANILGEIAHPPFTAKLNICKHYRKHTNGTIKQGHEAETSYKANHENAHTKRSAHALGKLVSVPHCLRPGQRQQKICRFWKCDSAIKGRFHKHIDGWHVLYYLPLFQTK
jgi:hypothetical protein